MRLSYELNCCCCLKTIFLGEYVVGLFNQNCIAIRADRPVYTGLNRFIVAGLLPSDTISALILNLGDCTPGASSLGSVQ